MMTVEDEDKTRVLKPTRCQGWKYPWGERGVPDDPTSAGHDDDTTLGVQYYGPDQIAREFTIEPTDVWQGEANKTFMVSFTAKGPMYDTADEAAQKSF